MSVSFGIRGDELSPAEITDLLMVRPTKAWQKGDIYKSKYRKNDGSFDYRDAKRPWGIWEFSSSINVSSENLEDHASYVAEKIEPSNDQIRRLIRQKDLRVYINIWWQPEDGYGGYTLSADTVKRLSVLCSEMDFYFS